MIVFAVVAAFIPRNIPIAAIVAPSAGRFFMNLPNALITLNFSVFSFVLTVFSSTRTVHSLIINMKAIKPITPMISAAINTLSPSKTSICLPVNGFNTASPAA